MTTTHSPRDVQVFPIAAQTMAMRSRSWNRLRFEIEYALERGTTANSYVISADKTALIDPPGESFLDRFLTELTRHIDLYQITYIVLGHINPNRAATLKILLQRLPDVTVVCSNPAALALKDLLPDASPRVRVIRSGDDELDLGQGHRLQFIPIPTPRWPGGLATYDTYTQVLYTDKFFGAHLCGDDVYDLGWDELLEDRRYYFDCLMAPSARQVMTVLDRLEAFPLRVMAPGHGPIVLYGARELFQSYRQWSVAQKGQEYSVALIYASAYGNTATMAQALARGITKAEMAVEAINAEQADPEEIRTAVEKSAGFLIGSPTLGGHAPTQIQTALGIVLSTASKTQPAGVFGSFGWSGEAIDLLEAKLKDAGYTLAFEPLRVKFKPTDVTLKYCEEVGTDFAQSLKKTKRAKQPRTPASSVEQAVGRLVGSLSVVTAYQGEVASAMLASWVAQATFNPPGFTIAVAKDRAIESLLYPGNAFVLNLLAEGKHIGPMKHFLKPFGPGEDRFAGIDTKPAANGAPVLQDAIACLECRVEKRMECGDHWVVYAIATAGQVLDPEAKTAVHQRKSGRHY
ncbi:Putative diflavin flavoprotein A 5 [Halomicronema hongdechloris C2206]|uniref:Diflavin flavoprotein A 5 n=1 Tax=Halomicronema hongdechloris C2206 TaxID=1641165 RepID=A0A1Z3HP99_9CYAN|nr:diflavin flavoprotein [Halomicronema hongdechloris]ASC72115.1 Putative diflavin flavoprotein A 5 [Halomicronema hongdechloris C2206]